MNQIYLDYSATAPIRPEVARAMQPYLSRCFGNPASTHRVGQQALNMIDRARRDVAKIFNCYPNEVVFTGSGTEADNLAVKGSTLNFRKGHIITSAIEHSAVLESCHYLEKLGYGVTYIKPDRKGLVKVNKILTAIKPGTVLVSLMYVNNEVGTIQPIREIGKQLQKINQERSVPIIFHTDAVQAGMLMNLDVQYLHVDLMTISAHKLGGPKGVGVLFVRNGVNLVPQLHGGGQEQGVRSSTLNVAGIVGLAKALVLAQGEKGRETKRLRGLQLWTIGQIKKLPGVNINGDLKQRVPSNIHISVRNRFGNEMVIYFDRHNIATSAASTCSAGSKKLSHVLEAMNSRPGPASSGLRVSLGYQTKKPDLTKFIQVLKSLLREQKTR